MIRDCVVTENESLHRDGGGIYCSDGVRIENSTIARNTCDLKGGGIYMLNGGTRHTVENCVITNNVSLASAGGVSCNGGTVFRTLIKGNHSNQGGGADCDNGGILDSCYITGNSTAHGSGAGVRCGDDGILENCVVTGNSGSYYGGGVHLWSDGVIRNCTVVGNSSVTGGGIYSIGYLAGRIENTIIYFNTATGGRGNNYYNSETNTLYMHCCTTPQIEEGTNIVDDPYLVDYSGGDFSLRDA